MMGLPGFVLALMLLQVVPYGVPQGVPRQRTPPPVNPQGTSVDAVATFTGTFKSSDKKHLTITVDGGQTMQMFLTGSTKFFRDGKPAKAADFHADDNVSVDASRDARMNLLAVRVEAVKPAKAPDPKSDQ
jgi:hypothetical protein